ncbi:hypothetical protein LTR66_011840 [Elasticomyces elasticus]|nr:hypothetical protein LTR66_011840 [Elasticomyces elasticus]
MPPTNTPQVPTPGTPTQRPLTPLSYLSSPVLDLASTLMTQSEEDTDADNISFLRMPVDPSTHESPPPPPPADHRPSHSRAQGRSQRSHDQAREEVGAGGMSMSNNEGNATDADANPRDRLHRVLTRLSRFYDPAYSDRVPNQQSLYDWAPGMEEGGEDEAALDDIVRRLTEQQPDTHPDILRVLARGHMDSDREQEREALVMLRTGNMSLSPNHGPVLESSLRSAATLQRARRLRTSSRDDVLRYIMDRERNGNSPNREDRDRLANSRWFRSAPLTSTDNSRYELNRLAWQAQQRSNDAGGTNRVSSDSQQQREARARLDTFRRGYLPEPPIERRPVPSSSPPFLEMTLRYLDKLRSCLSYEDSLSAAVDYGFATKEFFADGHEDFIMSTRSVPPPPFSSWLQPGAIFEGSQHASHVSVATNTHNNSAATFRLPTNDSSEPPPPDSRPPPFDATRPWLSHSFVPPTTYPSASVVNARINEQESSDRWPVKVTIHAVDREKMTIAGTMEAYDVPHPSSQTHVFTSFATSARPSSVDANAANTSSYQPYNTKKAPITTYLEGHILDLTTHSFRTPQRPGHRPGSSTPSSHALPDTLAFPAASVATDAANWRKLPPFSTMSSDEEVSRCMLSKSRMSALANEYIFMRWKEKCFIHSKSDPCCAGRTRLGEGDDTDMGHGLTISGFYYVSLRRADGVLEGLYYDPSSSPFQCLRLRSRRVAPWGAWSFR